MQDITINSQMTNAELLKAVYDYATRIDFITQYTPHIESVPTPEKIAKHIGSIQRNRDPSTHYLMLFVGGVQLANFLGVDWQDYFDPCSSMKKIKTGHMGSALGCTIVTDAFFDFEDRWFDENAISILLIEKDTTADKFFTGWLMYGIDKPVPKPTLWRWLYALRRIFGPILRTG